MLVCRASGFVSFPYEFSIGGLRVHPHLLFEVLAYAVGFRLYLYRRRRLGDVLDGTTRWSIVAAAILGAAAGSRLAFWFEDPATTLAHWNDLVYLTSGKTVVGGLAGGWIAVEATKAALGISQRTGDVFAVPLAVGIAIGRVGCFLTGLSDRTFGMPSGLPWAVDFGDGVPRHPVQLYEALFAASVAAWLWSAPMDARGLVFRRFIVAYMLWRVAVDWLKPDIRVFAGLSSLQLMALTAAAWGIWLTVKERSTTPVAAGL